MTDAVLVAVVTGATTIVGFVVNRRLADVKLKENTEAVRAIHITVNSERERLLAKVDTLNEEIRHLTAKIVALHEEIRHLTTEAIKRKEK